MSDHRYWQITSGFELYWRSWGNEYVVYHSGTGDTHLLNKLAASVLESLKQAPSDIPSLSKQLASSFGIALDDESRMAMAQLMKDMIKFGLIEEVDK